MTTTAVRFNPFSPEFHANPYLTYDRLRIENPIHWSFLDAWIITRYADAESVLKEPHFKVDDLPERLQHKSRYLKQGNFDVLSKTIGKWLFFLETPDHTRLRTLVSKAFSSVAVEAMCPEIQEIVDSLIFKVKHSGEMDIITDLASPLPAMTVAKILGVPPEDSYKLVRWSCELFFVFDQPLPLESYQKQNQIALEAREYLLELIAQQEKQPVNGLISRLIAARDEGNKLTQDEILGFCIMLFIVGQETTKALIGNAMLALLNHPKEMEQLKQNPSIIKNAVDELLRYDSPVQVIARLAVKDVEIGGKTIRTGDKVIICLGSANRDPEQFCNPDRIDFNRKNRNLPFGGGIHFCLGAYLAKVQGQIAINSILQQLPNIKLKTDKLDWRESITLRGLKTLLVNFSASTP